MSVRAELARVVEVIAGMAEAEQAFASDKGTFAAVCANKARRKAGAAAINFLRDHHAALLAAVEDGERYRYLRNNPPRNLAVYLSGAYWDGLGLDAAIDRARDALKNGEE